MQNDKTLKQVEGQEPARELQISENLKIRVTAKQLTFIQMSPDTDDPEASFSINSEDGMEVAKFIVLLLPIGQRLKVAAALTTSVAKAIG